MWKAADVSPWSLLLPRSCGRCYHPNYTCIICASSELTRKDMGIPVRAGPRRLFQSSVDKGFQRVPPWAQDRSIVLHRHTRKLFVAQKVNTITANARKLRWPWWQMPGGLVEGQRVSSILAAVATGCVDTDVSLAPRVEPETGPGERETLSRGAECSTRH